MRTSASLLQVLASAWVLSFAHAACEICGCSTCEPVGSFNVTKKEGIIDIPEEFQKDLQGLKQLPCGIFESLGPQIPDEACLDMWRLLPIFRETCGCPPVPVMDVSAPTPAPTTPYPVIGIPPPPILYGNQTDPISYSTGTDSACLELAGGCYLENTLTGVVRWLEPTDLNGYEVMEDDSKWFWTVMCSYSPVPGVVSFKYDTADSTSEKLEFHEPFYMAGDKDGVPHGVNPFLSTCGSKSFEVYGDLDACASATTVYHLEAYCDEKSYPVSAPTMAPTKSACSDANEVVERAGSILDALKGKFSRKTDRMLKKDDDKKKKSDKKDKKKKDYHSKDTKMKDDKKNDDKYYDKDDDDSDGPLNFSFDFVAADKDSCELSIGAQINIDTRILGIPIKLDGDIVINGIALAEEDGKTLCIEELHVGKYDFFGLTKTLLNLLETQVLKADLPHYIDDMLGGEICI